jgi:predicted ABC-type ATPase
VVLAGTNGAGKSSIGGAALRAAGAEYFNPDEATRRIMTANPGVSLGDANAAAWQEGRRLLESAIDTRHDFAFETTLGGNTMTTLLEQACTAGIQVLVWYVGLATVDLHLRRVRARVDKGGHDIPEERLRERFHTSRANLIRLLPGLAALRVYDNSREADPSDGVAPEPRLLLHMVGGRVQTTCDLADAPEWVKPILAVALSANRD